MNIGAEYAVEELIANGDAGERGAGTEQAPDRWRRLLRRRRGGVPIWVAVRDLAALNGEQVLDHEGSPGKRPFTVTGYRLLQGMGTRAPTGSATGIAVMQSPEGRARWGSALFFPYAI